MRKNIGSTLITLSILLLFLIYYPFISLYLFPPSISLQPKSGSYILIPKINALAPIIENVDPWSEKEYKEALKKGVAKAKDTNFYFAHSSLPPWEMTRINTAFLRLSELEPGDQIKIVKDGQEQNFLVSGKKQVWPNEVQFLQSNSNQLVLQTCTPLGTAFKRLLVFANPI